MHFSTGELEFSDDDVIEITAGIKADDTNDAQRL
jgi:hypothetical protein